MKFLIAADFYSETELIEAPDKLTAEQYIIDMINYNEPSEEIKVIYHNGETLLDDLMAEADEILFITDYMPEE